MAHITHSINSILLLQHKHTHTHTHTQTKQFLAHNWSTLSHTITTQWVKLLECKQYNHIVYLGLCMTVMGNYTSMFTSTSHAELDSIQTGTHKPLYKLHSHYDVIKQTACLVCVCVCVCVCVSLCWRRRILFIECVMCAIGNYRFVSTAANIDRSQRNH